MLTIGYAVCTHSLIESSVIVIIPYTVGVIIPISQVRKLRLREVRKWVEVTGPHAFKDCVYNHYVGRGG